MLEFGAKKLLEELGESGSIYGGRWTDGISDHQTEGGSQHETLFISFHRCCPTEVPPAVCILK